jgi:5-methylcytosine-specific restriction protein A
MPYSLQPGCPLIVKGGRCTLHAKRHNHETRKLYHLRRWEKDLRPRVLADQAYSCAICGQVALSLHADHVIPHDGNPRLFWDRNNLQALCPTCHARKSREGA